MDNETLTHVYMRHVDMVYRLCFIHLKNHADAKDGVQEVFLRVKKYDSAFQSVEHEKAWIIHVTNNYCKDQHKKFWNRNRQNIDNIEELFGIYDKEQLQILQYVLNLPDKYKSIIYLHYYEGYTIEEIAKIQNINSSTLRSRMSKARSILKYQLEEDHYEQI